MSSIVKSIKNFIKQIDMLLLAFALIASIFGLILILSATKSYNTYSFIKTQSVAIAVGVVIYLVLSWIDIDTITNYWKYIYVLNIILIGSLYFFGTGAADTGNRAWIRFSMFGGIQPAELGKVLFIVTLSSHMYKLRNEINSVLSIIKLCIHALIPIAMIILISDDMGMAVVYAMIFIIMAFCAGIKLRYFLGAGALACLSAPFIWNYFLKDYQKLRILVVFNPELDPLGKGYHAIQSKIALGAGQFFGRGLFRGTQTQYGYLPAKHTDFIFAVAGEELGLIGCLCIVAILTVIILRCLQIASKSYNTPTYLVCIGVAGMLIFQTFENIGMCLGIMPIIGLTLPFFSCGGSSIMTVFAVIGLVSSARMRAKPTWLSK